MVNSYIHRLLMGRLELKLDRARFVEMILEEVYKRALMFDEFRGSARDLMASMETERRKKLNEQGPGVGMATAVASQLAATINARQRQMLDELERLPPEATAAMMNDDPNAFFEALGDFHEHFPEILQAIADSNAASLNDFAMDVADDLGRSWEIDDDGDSYLRDPQHDSTEGSESSSNAAPSRREQRRDSRRERRATSGPALPTPAMVRDQHVVSDFGTDEDGDWAFVVQNPASADEFFRITGRYSDITIHQYRTGDRYRSLKPLNSPAWGEVWIDPDKKLFRIYYDENDDSSYVDLEYNPVGDKRPEGKKESK